MILFGLYDWDCQTVRVQIDLEKESYIFIIRSIKLSRIYITNIGVKSLNIKKINNYVALISIEPSLRKKEAVSLVTGPRKPNVDYFVAKTK